MSRLNREESQARTRELLIAAARSEIVKKGFALASVRDIADAAGFSQGAFYSNFPDKEAILLELVQQHQTEERARIQAALNSAEGDAASAMAGIEKWSATVNADPGFAVLAIELQLQALRSPGCGNLQRAEPQAPPRAGYVRHCAVRTVRQGGARRACGNRRELHRARPQPGAAVGRCRGTAQRTDHHDVPQSADRIGAVSPRGALRDAKAGVQNTVPEKTDLNTAPSAGTNLARPELSPIPQRRECAMKLANIVIAGTAALTIVSSSALAQQTLTGTVMKIDRLNGTVGIQQTPAGTVGAGGGGAAEQFKVQSGISLEALHAGDKVNFSVTGSGDAKTITKLERR
jgi:AcrR family transcriptional regulator/Cu/Ag efflux protein CusF